MAEGGTRYGERMSEVVCRVCGSERVIPDAEVRDYDATSYRGLSVVADRAVPQPTTFLGIIPATVASTSGVLRARVCADCRHVDLHTPDAARMWAEYSGEGDGRPTG